MEVRDKTAKVATFSPHQAAYFALELIRRSRSDDAGKLGTSLFNATVDLNPHQVDAALFAFRSPLSRGAVLADEVGLGKTIEAGLILSQLWAERRRRVLVICPTMLRKQWAQELQDKFNISAFVVDTKVYNKLRKAGKSPLEPQSEVVICSYNFAASKEDELVGIPWDLVIIDEAHRLRNVWKNEKGYAAKIKSAVSSRPIVLLTATPLQNNLTELYGLIGFIDPQIFGDLDAFRARYMRGTPSDRELNDLRMRLSPVVQRTLRRQVQEFIRFTNRRAITQPFEPHEDEQELYEKVSSFLQRPATAAIPERQRHLLTLIVRKLLASSSFAIANTLQTLIDRLATSHGDLLEQLDQDYETADELAEEIESVGSVTEGPSAHQIKAEIEELAGYMEAAKRIERNAKGEALLLALRSGFEKLAELGANRKAVVFTESTRTQKYLLDLLSENGFAGRLVAINGSNTGEESRRIYRDWAERHKGEAIVTGNKDVDVRTALVEEFRDHADVLIATEAAGEGVNLQFCSLVVNYDLPWNPQRIEQRIGRCHRYGQKFDVVVVNFLNQKNAADQRVYQLLSGKLRLFEGVFGASDQILGALESGLDFESRILEIYQNCRSKKDIDAAFDQLQLELSDEIESRMGETQQKLLEHFDDEVRERIRVSGKAAEVRLDELEQTLWRLTVACLGETARYLDGHSFVLEQPQADTLGVPSGRYDLARGNQEAGSAQRYRPDHPLAQQLIEDAQKSELRPSRLTVKYDPKEGKAGILEPLVGKEGWLMLSRLVMKSQEEEDVLLFAVIDSLGNVLDQEVGAKLFARPCEGVEQIEFPGEIRGQLTNQTERMRNARLEDLQASNARYFEAEIDKLDRWADDKKHGLEVAIREMDREIRQLAKEARLAPSLQEKLDWNRRKAAVESERIRKRRELFVAQDEIDERKGQLIEAVEARLALSVELTTVALIQWRIL